MPPSSDWLREYVMSKGIDAEIVEVGKASTVKEAAEALGCSRRQIVKSIVLVAGDEPVVAVVDGVSSVDLERVHRILGVPVRIAGKDEVPRLTGFRAGGVPPIGHNCRILLDEGVLEMERVYGGGGDERHLLHIRPRDIVRECTAVARIRK
ncbi:aminoacyl-tRNA deacylase [Geoglobus acetivorans]|uniref:Prolyl-tRNA synthetase n=1 Tax=Geoglobus acetivorans TaxID=565033 RepID=A0A0A7GFD1_GEOAI|nr:prolyl-tRNA synthetase [Geoglobus acetivorans]